MAFERVNINPFREARFIAQQSLQLGLQRIRQRVGERRQQDAGVGVRARQIGGPMQRNDGLARACRAGDTRRAGIVAFHPLALLGVQEDCPLLPGEIEGAFQFLHIRHDAEPPLGIGMIEGIGHRHGWLEHTGLATRRQFQQRLRSLGWQVLGQDQQACPPLPSLRRQATRQARHSQVVHRRTYREKMGFFAAGGLGSMGISVCRYTGTMTSFTVSRISTNWAAPVLGCVSSLRRSAQS